MKLLITGSTGLVGSALVPFLKSKGHRIIRAVRKPPAVANEAFFIWDPDTDTLPVSELEGVEGVIHLAGESIASGRWTREKKKRIRNSRVHGTQLLARAVARLNKPPTLFLSASAIGFYGDRGEEMLTEKSRVGSGFLSEVCQEWEHASAPAQQRGIRSVQLRIGIVLSPKGGALAQMLPPFKAGVGGRLGNGRQYMSWIALEDLIGVIDHALNTEALSGPVNAVAPQPVTNQEFTKALGRVLSRPTFFSVPAIGARLLFGEMAEALLLSSARVQPEKLLGSGYSFRFTDLEPTLRAILKGNDK